MTGQGYRLQPDISVTSFLRTVDKCRGEVTLESRAGDVLNLKSQLCKYLMLAAASDPEYLNSCVIVCGEEDAKVLADYL